MGMNTIDEFGILIDNLVIRNDKFTEAELKEFALIEINQKSPAFNVKHVTEGDMFEMYRKSLL